MIWNFEIHWNVELGSGGEGTVYLARATNNGRMYAIKIANALRWVDARAALMREYERHQRACGAGVVTLVAWNFDGPTPFLAYELADRGSLADEIANLRRHHKVHHPTGALDRVRSLLVGLSTAHSRGIVHRDVKPSNLVLVNGQLKLTDFGTGRTIARPVHLQTTAFVGTAAYAAPEQKRSSAAVDHRADLYSVGVVLYEMLMGERPSVSKPLRLPTSRWGNVTPRLELLVLWLLQVDPARRPANAQVAIEWVDMVRAEYAHLSKPYLRLSLVG